MVQSLFIVQEMKEQIHLLFQVMILMVIMLQKPLLELMELQQLEQLPLKKLFQSRLTVTQLAL